MSAKPNKTPAGNKNDLKTTIIVILFVIVGIQAFMLFHKGKAPVAPVVKAPLPAPVAAKPAVKPREIPPSVPVMPLVKLAPGSAGKIAFVLDDWGYTTRNCKYLKDIKQPLAIAVLPNLRHTQDAEQCASAAGKIVMLHLPLEPYHNNDPYPDNYLITVKMKPSQVVKLLEDTLAQMPMVQGVNNHMGSRATEDKALMSLIFKHLKKHNLFFMDSMTSPHHSVCAEVAQQMRLPFTQRDVFLDNINTREEIHKQIVVLAQKARKKGYAVAIGHDRDLTLRVLRDEIPALEAQGFEIVGVNEFLRNK